MKEINLGIIGGGQLGSMLCVAAKKLNIQTRLSIQKDIVVLKHILIVFF